MVTSAAGSSTVVGASPRYVWRYSPSTFSIRIALVVVLPQSVARITLIDDGSNGVDAALGAGVVDSGVVIRVGLQSVSERISWAAEVAA